MEKLGFINDREILYQKHDLAINWSEFLPESNWLFVGLIETDNSTVLDKISRKIVDNEACYACCVGSFGEKMHDIIDANIINRETKIENLNFPNHHFVTTWHKNTAEGLWFASYAAFHETELIEKIFCLDIGKDSNKDVIIELIIKFNKGYLVEDE